MSPTVSFYHTNGFHIQRFQCPLLFPQPTDQSCTHEQFAKGKGCVKDLSWESGGIQRIILDRTGPLCHAVYTQRTVCEHINSQTKELGIERPRVHNARSVASLNTLISLVVNVRALQRVKSINARLPSTLKGFR